jgi:hypothetical protein
MFQHHVFDRWVVLEREAKESGRGYLRDESDVRMSSVGRKASVMSPCLARVCEIVGGGLGQKGG